LFWVLNSLDKISTKFAYLVSQQAIGLENSLLNINEWKNYGNKKFKRRLNYSCER